MRLALGHWPYTILQTASSALHVVSNHSSLFPFLCTPHIPLFSSQSPTLAAISIAVIAIANYGLLYSPWPEIVIAFGLVLLALAAPLHFRTRNTSTILYICWVFTAKLIVLINRIIWHDHVRSSAPIWCDICQSSVFLLLPLPR